MAAECKTQAKTNGQSQRGSSVPTSSQPAEQADSDDMQSVEEAENELDDHHDGVTLGKRKRPISVSCELCKQRKVKCDRGQPSCGWCSRNSTHCEYKERKKPGLRAGYGRELELRLDKLDEILRTHSDILQNIMVAQPVSPTDGPGPGRMVHYRASTSVRGSNGSIPSDHGTPREVSTAIPSFSPSGPALLRTSQAETALFLQKPCTMGFGMVPPTADLQDGFRAMISPAGHAPTTAAQEYYGTRQASSGPLQSPTGSLSHSQPAAEQELPPYDLLYALVELYFKHINTWCPILHRKSTFDSLFGPLMVEEADKVLLHAVVATTLRYSTDARLTDGRRRHHHDLSKQKVLLYGLENSSVKALQALVILALDLCGSRNGPPGWNIMALITRSVVQLGLAVETNSTSIAPKYASIHTLRAMILPEPRDFVDEESRRRLFWMIYLLDRYATIATAFEFGLDDREIDRTLPCRDDLWIRNQKVETRWFRADEASQHDRHATAQGAEYEPDKADKPENLGAFSYYMEILAILSHVHNFLKQPVDISVLSDVEQWQMRYKKLDSMLQTWKFVLPGEFGNMARLFQPGSAKTINCGWVMLHATYHTTVIRLHSSAAYPTTQSPIFTSSYSALQRCHGAVENIAALADFVVANCLITKLGPPFAWTLWVAARLLLVHGSTVEHKLAAPQIGFFVNTLREMGRHWPVAQRYCELLTRVLDEQRASEEQGDGVTPSSVRILADMRRTAFDLDVLISRQPKMMVSAVAGDGSGNGPGAGWQSNLLGSTPARTPAPNELEYLHVFDFFNVPRVPHTAGGGMTGTTSAIADGEDAAGAGTGQTLPVSGEFNTTDYIMDTSRDWLFKQDGAKFVS